MERLYLPPSLRYFVPLRTLNGSPGMHASLEYDLVEAARPKLVVDVGSNDALSFSVLCQSMRDHDVDGLAYAVDTWESDEAREAAGHTSATELNNFFHAEFRFAYMLKQSLEDALSHFSNGSIGLLRVDAARLDRPFDAVLDAWLPKLEPAGLMLCAGLFEHPGALDAFRARAPNAPVFDRGGLGILAGDSLTSGAPSHELLAWLSDGDERARAGLYSFYAHAWLHRTLAADIAEHGESLNRKRT